MKISFLYFYLKGNIPEDASIGFLPPSNGTFGKGFVEFEVSLMSQIKHLTIIEANASIIFDQNEPMDTNHLFYTIDDELPEVSIEFNSNINRLVLKAKDNESGIREIILFDKLENIFISTNDSNLIIELDARTLPYEIYYTVLDNVFNSIQNKFFQIINVMPTKPPGCASNCSGNGICIDNNYCQCNNNFKGENCNVSLTLEELLSEPPQLIFGLFPTYQRNKIDFIIENREANEVFVKIITIPVGFNIKYDNQTITKDTLIKLDRKLESKLEIFYTENAKNFTAEFNVTTTRCDNITKSQITLSYTLFYPITIIEYFVEYEIKIESTCFDPTRKENFFTLKNSQLLQSDKLNFFVIKKPSFIELNLTRIENEVYRLYISSDEEFYEIDFDIEFSVNNNSNIGSKELITCKVCDQGGSSNTGGLSTGAIVGIVFGVFVFVLIVGIIIYKKTRN